MSIAQTVSSKLCAENKRFSSYSESGKNFLSFPTIRKRSINLSFRFDLPKSQTRKTFKNYVRESDEEEENEEEEDDKKDFLEKEDDEKDDFRAEETVLKLYTDIKNRNIDGISEVIGDECQCFCNFLSTNRLLQGKKVSILLS